MPVIGCEFPALELALCLYHSGYSFEFCEFEAQPKQRAHNSRERKRCILNNLLIYSRLEKSYKALSRHVNLYAAISQ